MPHVPRAKTAVPALPPEFVERPGLRAALDDAAAAADVVLVRAPAGYGKTLLLADWSRSGTGIDTAWVGLDRDDNDPARLWSAVVAAIAGCPSVPRSLGLQDATAPADARPDLVPALAAALHALPRPVRLVLDDVHELVDAETLHGLRTFTRTAPPCVRLVLSCRADPPLSLPRLRLAGRLRELGAEQLCLTREEAAALLERSGVRLAPAQVDALHRRTGGWAAGLRLAALGVAEAADRDAFLTQFSGDDPVVADYLAGEILSALPEDVQEFLRVISISDPVPTGLAAELSGRDDAGHLLDRLEHRTSLVAATGPRRRSYHVQELLRTHLVADLQRHGLRRAAGLHAAAAEWWAGQERPVPALEHAGQSGEPALVTDLLHRFAVPLLVAGDHDPLRRALASVGAHGAATDPRLAVLSALSNIEAGELAAARGDLRRAQRSWPAQGATDLVVLRAVAERLGGGVDGAASALPDPEELPAEPELEALARLGRGCARWEHDDRPAARAEFEAALVLSRRHGFDYLTMQCLALLAAVAGECGDARTMRATSREALVAAAEHGWTGSTWSIGATAMLAYTDLLRCAPADAERLAAEGLEVASTTASPVLRFVLEGVHGAAVFDLGGRADGLAEMQRARSSFGDDETTVEQCAAMASLEFRAALLLGHSAAAHAVLGWLAERAGDGADLLVMRACAEAAAGRHDHARSLVRPVLHNPAAALLPASAVEGWLLETSLAIAAGERGAARTALHAALTAAEPLDALRPFAQAGREVRELLVQQRGGFGPSDGFAEQVLAAGAGREHQGPVLSERELTVLGLLPSLLSLDEIAANLTVSVNTVKSHVRSIYTKLGVSSRRLAVLAAHEHGLLHGGVR